MLHMLSIAISSAFRNQGWVRVINNYRKLTCLTHCSTLLSMTSQVLKLICQGKLFPVFRRDFDLFIFNPSLGSLILLFCPICFISSHLFICVTGFILLACCFGGRSTALFCSFGSYPWEVFQTETHWLRTYVTWEKPALFAYKWLRCLHAVMFCVCFSAWGRKKRKSHTNPSRFDYQILSGRGGKVQKGSVRLLLNWYWGGRKIRKHRSIQYQI